MRIVLALAVGISLGIQPVAAQNCGCPVQSYYRSDPGVCGALLTFLVPADEYCVRHIRWEDFYPVGTYPNRFADMWGCTPTFTVFDDQPPWIGCPGDLTINATSPAGATVLFPTPTATDNCPGRIEIVCSPPSGSSLSPGSTDAFCKAQNLDSQWIEGLCEFRINVLSADLAIAESGPPTITPGIPFTLDLTVRNDGPTEAPGVMVIATLPAGLSAIGFAGVATCSGLTTITCSFPTPLASGATATISIDVEGEPAPGTVSSTATVSGTAPDFNAANNTATLALLAIAAAPALSVWALIALGAALAAVALLRMR